MVLPEVNILVYANWEDTTANHPAYLEWLQNMLKSDEAFGLADIVLSGFMRIVTHPKVFKKTVSGMHYRVAWMECNGIRVNYLMLNLLVLSLTLLPSLVEIKAFRFAAVILNS